MLSETIRCALEKREREGTPFQDLATELVCHGLHWMVGQEEGNYSRKHMERSGSTCSHAKAFEKWAKKMGYHDIFKAMTQELVKRNVEQK